MCYMGTLSAFLGANQGYNSVGVILLGYECKIEIWAFYCVLKHRI